MESRRQFGYQQEQEASAHAWRQQTNWEAQNYGKTVKPTYQDSKVSKSSRNCLFIDSRDQDLYTSKVSYDSLIRTHYKTHRSNYEMKRNEMNISRRDRDRSYDTRTPHPYPISPNASYRDGIELEKLLGRL